MVQPMCDIYEMCFVYIMSFVRGAIYCWLWYTSIFSGYVLLYCPLLPLLLVSNKLYRQITDYIFRFWELYPTALLQLMCGTKFIVTGDRIRQRDMAVLVMNHRTRTDWNFLWPIVHLAADGDHHNMKFILKDMIKHVPGPGWVMQLSCFLYIKRRWETDKVRIKDFIQYLHSLGQKCQILVFPEGTDLTKYTLDRSHEFASRNNLHKYSYVLHPRTTGFSYLTSQLKKSSQLDAVYDLTLAYPDLVPQTEKMILFGMFPKRVHCHIKRYSSKSLPESEQELKTFLNDRWRQKEHLLKDFYANKTFESKFRLKKRDKTRLILAAVFWSVLPIVTAVTLYHSSFMRLVFMSHTVTLVLVSLLANSFIDLEFCLYRFKTKYLEFSH